MTTGSEKTGQPEPPAHLERDGRQLWVDLIREYGLGDDSAGLALLAVACACLDRTRAAQKAIRRHGALVRDRYGGRRLNPACALERDARAGFLAALKQMNLDVEPLQRDLGESPRQPKENVSRGVVPFRR